ncbi:hypothetical protein GA0116948_107139 [Chitinophaga costaii]|uniref:Uncharacterized protein n=1 Tax=Chitinophaga costaii TaxID=1335309 RepID=A0A1C4E773_9BACT|nr:hypothetical protein [Chitinophaga costaii]PUZ24272.1 hypothetical protein DCM91_12640 [Chitinophaga costaii]SCC39507.1 hypothetical protein GA0116948_107139 [Chitinophaga costaii]
MNFSNPTTLLYIVLTLGAIYMIFTTVKDLVKKPKAGEVTATPPAGTTIPGVAPIATDHKTLPLQLQAYERLVLLVERLTPQSLINRVYDQEMSATEMHVALISTIKAEFDHNITQQIYVSSGAWDAVKTVKENTIALINQTYSSLPAGATAADLNRAILTIYMQFPEAPTDLAAQIISSEAKRIMG